MTPPSPRLQTPSSNEALEQTRSEIAQLRRQVKDAKEAEHADESARRWAIGRPIPVAEWKNAGTSTVHAALETVLSGGASGDIETFARTIAFFSERTRTAAEKMLESLRAKIPPEVTTPEQLLAFLTIKDVPRGAAEVRGYSPVEKWPGPTQLIDLLLTGEDGTTRSTRLIFMQSNAQWKLVVMDGVIEKYAAQLRAAPAGEASP